ncbi:hypothetical protein KUCAC02_028680 [Chaenocephalus aceratus]|uniref:Uncharacterized protein n=1 Tax=Chaenocephalus aceratus TaxID=36190 RepID=A0ACB9X355_CHAAC|nr:hypothetical protein KUCAC02_028680 [Chaenocephalus aceratus]
MYIRGNNGRERRLLSGVDLSRPLWAMIDIYGQTCAISLLAQRKGVFFTPDAPVLPRRWRRTVLRCVHGDAGQHHSALWPPVFMHPVRLQSLEAVWHLPAVPDRTSELHRGNGRRASVRA